MRIILTRISGLALVAAGLVFSQPARAQAPAWQSAIAASQTDDAYFTDVASDANGNVYVTGHFKGTITLGSISLTSAGGTDVFVAKYQTSNNTFTWAQRAGGPDDDNAAAIASSGTSVYVVGNFSSAISNFGTIALTKAGWTNGFLVKLTDMGTTGTFVWAQGTGGPSIDGISDIAVSNNSLYITGNFFGPTLNLGDTVLTLLVWQTSLSPS